MDRYQKEALHFLFLVDVRQGARESSELLSRQLLDMPNHDDTVFSIVAHDGERAGLLAATASPNNAAENLRQYWENPRPLTINLSEHRKQSKRNLPGLPEFSPHVVITVEPNETAKSIRSNKGSPEVAAILDLVGPHYSHLQWNFRQKRISHRIDYLIQKHFQNRRYAELINLMRDTVNGQKSKDNLAFMQGYLINPAGIAITLRGHTSKPHRREHATLKERILKSGIAVYGAIVLTLAIAVYLSIPRHPKVETSALPPSPPMDAVPTQIQPPSIPVQPIERSAPPVEEIAKREPAAPVLLPVEREKTIQAVITGGIIDAFPFGDTTLTESYKAKLRELAGLFDELSKQGKCNQLIIEGRADHKTETAEGNQRTSAKRAEVVADFLKSTGLAIPIGITGLSDRAPLRDEAGKERPPEQQRSVVLRCVHF